MISIFSTAKDKNRDAQRDFSSSRVVSDENADRRKASRAKNPRKWAVTCAKVLRIAPVNTVEAWARASKSGLWGHDAAAQPGMQKKVFTSAADSFNIGL
jgi:hypothetical protein